MISALAAKDFARQFSSVILGAEGVGPFLAELLCRALASEVLDESTSDTEVDSGLCTAQEKYPFNADKEIKMYGPEKLPIPTHVFQYFPVLVLDDFNEATDENEAFVQKLFQVASKENVIVFILTSNQAWATKLAVLNQGCKIKPLHGNVDNPNYAITHPFPKEEVPLWNSLEWPMETLRELIRPLCEKHNINPTVVQDSAETTPVTACDRALLEAGY
ncbi:MAG: hypothetical protein SGILL_003770 [Bacillariaceae sp.]